MVRDVVESYMEDNDFLNNMVDDEYDDYVHNIVVFEIDTYHLDPQLLKIDQNVRNNDYATYEYAGKISMSSLKKL